MAAPRCTAHPYAILPHLTRTHSLYASMKLEVLLVSMSYLAAAKRTSAKQGCHCCYRRLGRYRRDAPTVHGSSLLGKISRGRMHPRERAEFDQGCRQPGGERADADAQQC